LGKIIMRGGGVELKREKKNVISAQQHHITAETI